MFTIRFVTDRHVPPQQVALRWAPHWEIDRGGVYGDGAWTFHLDEPDFPRGIDYKFVLVPGQWMEGPNLHLGQNELLNGAEHGDAEVVFEKRDALITEHGSVAQRLLKRNMDPHREYEVIVVGSGMGGGILASRLADAGVDVLVLEAGSLLFPTHVGNLPRRLSFGAPQKHVWSLWPDFKVINYEGDEAPEFDGGQAFNLGGRSVFWGGLIPRQSEWELASWPADVRSDLLNTWYSEAEEALNRTPPDPSDYQRDSKAALEGHFPGYAAEDAAMALQYEGATPWSVPAGFFSTASLLLEDILVDDPGPGRARPTLNLHFAVWSVTTDPDDDQRVTGVRGWDLLAGKERVFRGRTVVLAAGTIESAKIAMNSALNDPNVLIGKGITDHTIRYRHFTLPPDSPLVKQGDSAKVILRHPHATPDQHGFHLVVELGAEFNQGLYTNPENLREVREHQDDRMLCEVVAMFYADLDDTNHLKETSAPGSRPELIMRRVPPTAADLAETETLVADFFNASGATPLGPQGATLEQAGLGAVGHEVGTLRMADDGTAVVDSDLCFLGYDNLYACDNSVFPASPAANPSLTLAALALRLAELLAPE